MYYCNNYFFFKLQLSECFIYLIYILYHLKSDNKNNIIKV